jgi:SAM-dependent methyltransferase
MVESDSENRVGSYSEVAAEYYDSALHPTCANFREGSLQLIGGWLEKLATPLSTILETGAGNSVVGELLQHQGRSVRQFVATDSSSAMLSYTRMAGCCLPLAVCDAKQLPFASDRFDLVVSSLGDPYNTSEFWQEARRVLRPGGYILFTSPAADWAERFRSGIRRAEFTTADGRVVSVPSYVEPDDAEKRLIESCQLDLVEAQTFDDSQLRRTARSRKLRAGVVVTGYLVQKN